MYFKEIIDEFNCGKKIRRASWPIGVTISRNFDNITIKDLLANDWEVLETNKKTWWKPKFDETYWSIRPWTGAVRTCYMDEKVDGFAVSMGLCFQTEEQAEFMVEKLKVIHELEKFPYENNSEQIDWSDVNQEKLYLGMNPKIKSIDIFHTCSWIYIPFNVFFTSEVIARKAIEAIGEDRIKKYYFGVNEDGRK